MSGIGYGISTVFRRQFEGVVYDVKAAAYFAAVPNAFDSARKAIIDTFIAGLRADGNLAKLDRLWLFANTTTGNALIDVIGLNAATLVNAPIFTANQGYGTDGVTNYINTGYNTSTNSLNLTLNSIIASVYMRLDGAAGGGTCAFGNNNGVSYFNLQPFRVGNTARAYVSFGGAAADLMYANTSAKGCFTIGKTASGANSIYENGVSQDTSADTSEALPNLNMYVGCQNDAGSALLFHENQYSVFALGSGTINQATLYTRIQAYMTSLGTAV